MSFGKTRMATYTQRRRMMTTHMAGTREEWLKARVNLLAAEKELTRRSDEVARRRQELPRVKIHKKYRFETDEGSACEKSRFAEPKPRMPKRLSIAKYRIPKVLVL